LVYKIQWIKMHDETVTFITLCIKIVFIIFLP